MIHANYIVRVVIKIDASLLLLSVTPHNTNPPKHSHSGRSPKHLHHPLMVRMESLLHTPVRLRIVMWLSVHERLSATHGVLGCCKLYSYARSDCQP